MDDPRQAARAARFEALHAGPRAFVIANAWDAGSARILAGLGFAAIATSSGASAGTLGRRDGKVSRDEALAQAHAICAAIEDVPVSADLEKGFGDTPEAAAATIRLAAEAGLVGGSIEDATGDPSRPLYELAHDRDPAAQRLHGAALKASRGRATKARPQRLPGSTCMYLPMMPSMTSSAPPPIEARRPSRYMRETRLSQV
jgi:2-methylisocitrate lyase-like PEP mutase family enzyme